MGIHIKLLLNDFRKRAWKNIVLFVFMLLSVTIAASMVLMLSQLFLMQPYMPIKSFIWRTAG